MADGTKIEWSDATWNVITGCSVISPGCTNCYAMKLAGTRLRNHASRAGLTRDTKAGPVWTGEVRFNEQWLDQPMRWSRPRMIFVCAHGDLFAEGVTDAMLDKVFAVMALAPHHRFQVLTKRPERMREYLRGEWFGFRMREAMAALRPSPVIETTLPLPNVWLGVSVEDQSRADERIPVLLDTPAAVRWISAEPLLGPVDFGVAWHGEDALEAECWGDCAWCEKGHPPLHNCQRGKGDWEKGRSGLDWIVAGGESGHGARPMHPDWVRSIRDQCAAAGVPFLFKQWGEWIVPYDGDASCRVCGCTELYACEPDSCFWAESDLCSECVGKTEPDERAVKYHRAGKKAAGRELDGVTHDGFPEVRQP